MKESLWGAYSLHGFLPLSFSELQPQWQLGACPLERLPSVSALQLCTYLALAVLWSSHLNKLLFDFCPPEHPSHFAIDSYSCSLSITRLQVPWGTHSTSDSCRHGGLSRLLMKTIHKQSIPRIESSFTCTKLRSIAWKITLRGTAPERSRVFFGLCPARTKNIKQVKGMHSFKASRETDVRTSTASQYGLGTWEGILIIRGGLELVSQEGEHLIFIFNMNILYFWSLHLFLKLLKQMYNVYFDITRGCFS